MTGLVLDSVSMRFDLPNGSFVQALEDVSLDIKTGELMSVLGPSTSSPAFWPLPKARSF